MNIKKLQELKQQNMDGKRLDELDESRDRIKNSMIFRNLLDQKAEFDRRLKEMGIDRHAMKQIAETNKKVADAFSQGLLADLSVWRADAPWETERKRAIEALDRMRQAAAVPDEALMKAVSNGMIESALGEASSKLYGSLGEHFDLFSEARLNILKEIAEFKNRFTERAHVLPAAPRYAQSIEPRNFANETIEKVLESRNDLEKSYNGEAFVRIMISFGSKSLFVAAMESIDDERILVTVLHEGRVSEINVHYTNASFLLDPVPVDFDDIVH